MNLRPAATPVPLTVALLLVCILHGPLLFMQLPLTTSYDTNFHIFFASHYAQHWFEPWNEKWFAGFSQTTYPPAGHQWIALLSYMIGLRGAYMLVQFGALLLLPLAIKRFARLWVDEVSASYAAVLSPFLGAIYFLVYSAGQLSTVLAAPLYLITLPYLYRWLREGRLRDLVKGVVFGIVAASVHHVTLIFGSIFLAAPVFVLAWLDSSSEETGASKTGIISRGAVFAVLTGIGIGVVLLPYWLAIIRHPIEQIPIPHASRSNLLLKFDYLTNYFIVPYGAMILAFPFIFLRGSRERRLRPLLFGFWVALIFGLGGTTPIPRLLLGRAFDILTFERFTLLAVLLALPIVGLLAKELIERFQRRAQVGLTLAAASTVALALAWMTWSPFRPSGGLNVDSVIGFLNRDGHDHYRYLTLGFGNALPKVSTYTNASSVDGEYNSARLLPEMTHYGSAQLTSAKFYGAAGMESLRAMLKHANKYGLKYVFVHDTYYEPLLAFAGWRKIEVFDQGGIDVWSKDDVPNANKIESDAMPPPWQGWMWGVLPMTFSLLALVLVIGVPDRARVQEIESVPHRVPSHIFGEAS